MTALLSHRTIARHFGLNLVSHLTDINDGEPAYQRELLARLRRVQIAGARHGRAGYYPDGDFGSDADWCYGVGAEIQALEEILDIDDGAVFDLYSDAHSAFYRDGTINPEDRPGTGTRNQCFTFHFGAYGDTAVSVWARHLDDALEPAAEYLASHHPGLLESTLLTTPHRDPMPKFNTPATVQVHVIRTKWLGKTATRGPRIKATDVRTGRTHTLAYDYVDLDKSHLEAAGTLASRLDAGALIGQTSELHAGMCFVYAR